MSDLFPSDWHPGGGVDKPPPAAIVVGPGVAYQFGGLDGYAHNGLVVWHWCDHHLWAGRDAYDASPRLYVRWVPAGVGAHTLVSADPLHMEPSIYWPHCCGTHGFIRGGRWVGV